MIKDLHIKTNGIQTGTEYEQYITNTLNTLRFQAKRVGKNDCGVDIIATIGVKNQVYRFYIQCKYHNKPLGKTPIQEIFAGTAHSQEYGRPVVITNNNVTVEARKYARSLGVEIIADPEWAEFKEVIRRGEITNPNQNKGLLGMMIALALEDAKYLSKALPQEEPEKVQTKRELQYQIISDMEEAEEYAKESGRLHMLAAKYQQKAISLHKKVLLRNLDYD